MGQKVVFPLYRSARDFPLHFWNLPTIPSPDLSQEDRTEVTIRIAKHTARSTFLVSIAAQRKPEVLLKCSEVPWGASGASGASVYSV